MFCSYINVKEILPALVLCRCSTCVDPVHRVVLSHLSGLLKFLVSYWGLAMFLSNRVDGLCWDCVTVCFKEFQDVLITISDDESVAEDLDDCSNAEISRWVELWVINGAAWFGDSRTLQEFTTKDPCVSCGRLKDCHHLISKAIRKDKSSTLIFWTIWILRKQQEVNIWIIVTCNSLCRLIRFEKGSQFEKGARNRITSGGKYFLNYLPVNNGNRGLYTEGF